MNRRTFLQASAAVILTPGLLMPVRKIWTPRNPLFNGELGRWIGVDVASGSSGTVEIAMSYDGKHWVPYDGNTIAAELSGYMMMRSRELMTPTEIARRYRDTVWPR